jgi:hypothetical protein
MRTTLELPDSLFKHLKTRAAMEGSTLRDLVVQLVERGLQAPVASESAPAALPSIRLGAPMALRANEFSNANLSAMLDR